MNFSKVNTPSSLPAPNNWVAKQPNQPPSVAKGPSGPALLKQEAVQGPSQTQQTTAVKTAPAAKPIKKPIPLQKTQSSQQISRQQQLTSTTKQQAILQTIWQKGVVQTGPTPKLSVLQKQTPVTRPAQEEHNESPDVEKEETGHSEKTKSSKEKKETHKSHHHHAESQHQEPVKLQEKPLEQPKDQSKPRDQDQEKQGGRGQQQQQQSGQQRKEPEREQEEHPEVPTVLSGPSQPARPDQGKAHYQQLQHEKLPAADTSQELPHTRSSQEETPESDLPASNQPPASEKPASFNPETHQPVKKDMIQLMRQHNSDGFRGKAILDNSVHSYAKTSNTEKITEGIEKTREKDFPEKTLFFTTEATKNLNKISFVKGSARTTLLKQYEDLDKQIQTLTTALEKPETQDPKTIQGLKQEIKQLRLRQATFSKGVEALSQATNQLEKLVKEGKNPKQISAAKMEVAKCEQRLSSQMQFLTSDTNLLMAKYSSQFKKGAKVQNRLIFVMSPSGEFYVMDQSKRDITLPDGHTIISQAKIHHTSMLDGKDVGGGGELRVGAQLKDLADEVSIKEGFEGVWDKVDQTRSDFTKTLQTIQSKAETGVERRFIEAFKSKHIKNINEQIQKLESLPASPANEQKITALKTQRSELLDEKFLHGDPNTPASPLQKQFQTVKEKSFTEFKKKALPQILHNVLEAQFPKGQVEILSDQSGHYQPDMSFTGQAIKSLGQKDVELEKLTVSLGKKGDGQEELQVPAMGVKGFVDFGHTEDDLRKFNAQKQSMHEELRYQMGTGPKPASPEPPVSSGPPVQPHQEAAKPVYEEVDDKVSNAPHPSQTNYVERDPLLDADREPIRHTGEGERPETEQEQPVSTSTRPRVGAEGQDHYNFVDLDKQPKASDNKPPVQHSDLDEMPELEDIVTPERPSSRESASRLTSEQGQDHYNFVDLDKLPKASDSKPPVQHTNEDEMPELEDIVTPERPSPRESASRLTSEQGQDHYNFVDLDKLPKASDSKPPVQHSDEDEIPELEDIGTRPASTETPLRSTSEQKQDHYNFVDLDKLPKASDNKPPVQHSDENETTEQEHEQPVATDAPPRVTTGQGQDPYNFVDLDKLPKASDSKPPVQHTNEDEMPELEDIVTPERPLSRESSSRLSSNQGQDHYHFVDPDKPPKASDVKPPVQHSDEDEMPELEPIASHQESAPKDTPYRVSNQDKVPASSASLPLQHEEEPTPTVSDTSDGVTRWGSEPVRQTAADQRELKIQLTSLQSKQAAVSEVINQTQLTLDTQPNLPEPQKKELHKILTEAKADMRLIESQLKELSQTT